MNTKYLHTFAALGPQYKTGSYDKLNVVWWSSGNIYSHESCFSYGLKEISFPFLLNIIYSFYAIKVDRKQHLSWSKRNGYYVYIFCVMSKWLFHQFHCILKSIKIQLYMLYFKEIILKISKHIMTENIL